MVAFIKSFNSKNNFQASSTNYCIPCAGNSGNSYTNTDGASIPCQVLSEWFPKEGLSVLKEALGNIEPSFSVPFNCATATKAENANKLLQNGAKLQSGNYVAADKLNIGGTAAIATKSYNLTAEKSYDSYGRYGNGPNVIPNLSWAYGSFYNPNFNDGTTYTTANLAYTNAQIKGYNDTPITTSGNLIKSKYENS